MKKLIITLLSTVITISMFSPVKVLANKNNFILEEYNQYVMESILNDIQIQETEEGIEIYFPNINISEINLTQDQLNYIHDYALTLYSQDQVSLFHSTKGRKIHRVQSGKSVRRTIGGLAGNQPPGGNRFGSGGGFYHADKGGPVLPVSISFPQPYNFLSVTVSLGVSSTSGKFVTVPDTVNYYKLYVEKTYDFRPYVVWEIDVATGKKTKYASGITKILYNINQYAKKV